MKGKGYSCKIWNNDALVRDYIPITLNRTEYALYDAISGTVYHNAGTGAFTGPTFGTAYEYIKKDGKKVLVDAAIRDGNGAKIDTTYAPKSWVENKHYLTLADLPVWDGGNQ